MIRATFSRRFSMAHRLKHTVSSKCRALHGHDEIVRLSLVYSGNDHWDTARNMVADFAELKARWHTFIDDHIDHALQLGSDDPLLGYFIEEEPEQLRRIVILPGDPTTEVLCAAFVCKASAFIDHERFPYRVEAMTIEETPTNEVTVDRDAVRHFPAINGPGWWARCDMSINDYGLPAENIFAAAPE